MNASNGALDRGVSDLLDNDKEFFYNGFCYWVWGFFLFVFSFFWFFFFTPLGDFMRKKESIRKEMCVFSWSAVDRYSWTVSGVPKHTFLSVSCVFIIAMYLKCETHEDSLAYPGPFSMFY